MVWRIKAKDFKRRNTVEAEIETDQSGSDVLTSTAMSPLLQKGILMQNDAENDHCIMALKSNAN